MDEFLDKYVDSSPQLILSHRKQSLDLNPSNFRLGDNIHYPHHVSSCYEFDKTQRYRILNRIKRLGRDFKISESGPFSNQPIPGV
jgi:hypothetical protein